MGRVHKFESHARRARFLTAIAEGATPEQAVDRSGISHWKAVKVMSESDYLDVVSAIRGEAPAHGCALPGSVLEAEAA